MFSVIIMVDVMNYSTWVTYLTLQVCIWKKSIKLQSNAMINWLQMGKSASRSWDEAMLIGGEIKSVPLAVLKLCLSDGANKWVSK